MPATAMGFSEACDVKNAADFDKTKTGMPIGYITKLTIGGKAYTSGFTTIKDPLNPSSNQTAVIAFVSGISWQGNPSDPVQIVAEVNGQTMTDIKTDLGSLTDTSVVFQFDIYSYDVRPQDKGGKKWYKAFTSLGEDKNGSIAKEGSQLAIAVDNKASGALQDPETFTFSITIAPKRVASTLTIGTGNQLTKVWPWGVTES